VEYIDPLSITARARENQFLLNGAPHEYVWMQTKYFAAFHCIPFYEFIKINADLSSSTHSG
jgi:hypothetical protein